jgi:hypothetical protein
MSLFGRATAVLPEAEGPFKVAGDVYHQEALRRVGAGRHQAALDVAPDGRTGNGDEVVVTVRTHRIGWITADSPEERALFTIVQEQRQAGVEVRCWVRVETDTDLRADAEPGGRHHRALLLVPATSDIESGIGSPPALPAQGLEQGLVDPL